MRDLGSNRYLSDVGAFRDKLADVLKRYAERRDAADLEDREANPGERPDAVDFSRRGNADEIPVRLTAR